MIGTDVFEVFDEDYFLRGKQTGKSNYENYRWLPESTMLMVRTMTKHLGILRDDTILDFGCARGYVVKALRKCGYAAFGYDVSRWAIENCDLEVKQFLKLGPVDLGRQRYDWVIAKDVLEHIDIVGEHIDSIMSTARVGVFAVVPLAAQDGGRYVAPANELDVTHIHRLTLLTWASLFVHPDWRVEMSYRVPGIKDAYVDWPTSHGFIIARRLV